MKKTNQRKGFTIVELVIVIAVIAILAAVLIPTFGSVVDSAKQAAAQADANAIYTEYVAAVAEKGGDIEEGTLYIQVNGGYVKYENGKAVKTDDSYITTLPASSTQVGFDLDKDGTIEDGEKFAIYK